MIEIVGVRFKPVGKIYYFAPGQFQLNVGDGVIVETARGIEFGKVVIANRKIDEATFHSELKPVIRLTTENDYKTLENNKKKQAEAFRICSEKIKKHHLDMYLVDVEYTFDCGKVLFYFTADGRIDFRELVKDLAATFRTRIELRQIGVRDEAKELGSIGICGRPLCCNSFLGEFEPVSIKMAKEQGLSLNPTKISGACGRLMCCLKYEYETYEAFGKGLAREGAYVKTPDGTGTVISSNILQQKVTVKIDRQDIPREYDKKDVTVIKQAASRDDSNNADLKKLEGN